MSNDDGVGLGHGGGGPLLLGGSLFSSITNHDPSGLVATIHLFTVPVLTLAVTVLASSLLAT